MGARRRWPHKVGGDVASGSVVNASCVAGAVTGKAGADTSQVIAKPVKQVRFAAMSDWYEIVDSGFDDFTFDNKNADGTPCVRQPSKQRVGLPPPLRSSAAAMINAHKRACDWVCGGVRHDLPDAPTLL